MMGHPTHQEKARSIMPLILLPQMTAALLGIKATALEQLHHSGELKSTFLFYQCL